MIPEIGPHDRRDDGVLGDGVPLPNTPTGSTGVYDVADGDMTGLTETLRRRPKLRVVVIGPLLLVVLYWYGARLAPLTAQFDNKDFSHLWLGGRMVVSGHAEDLYNPETQELVYRRSNPAGESPRVWTEHFREVGCFYYPPPMAWFYALTAWLPLATASVANAYLNILLVLALSWWLSRGALNRPPWSAVCLAFLASPPFFENLALGQNAVLTTAVITAGWALCNKQRDFAAGVILGLLTCKPQWLLAVGWIPLAHRRWRILAGMLVAATALNLATMAAMGPGPFVSFASRLIELSNMYREPGYVLALQYSGLSVFRKWLGLGAWADWLGWGTAVLLAGVTWSVTRGSWRPGSMEFRRLWACSLLVSLWINPHLFQYELLMMVPILVALVSDWEGLTRREKAVAAGLFIFGYVALPWDHFWRFGRLLPVPNVAMLASWTFLVWLLSRHRSTYSTANAGPLDAVIR
ncbi:MAG: hypothetical protein H6Q33_1436 [Deltaproteobacteria bacterium]|nr:hypothetical protein [Deltaproteobacteria bacterium]